jgi:rhodanese-related sulfurtransferase
MYKGDVMPAEAYQRLTASDNAYLIDVRTDAEWGYVGIPAIDGLLRVSWQVFPSMERNPRFVQKVEEAGIPKDAEIFLICRSGARSAAAASALTEAGFSNCYNVAEGFEGDRDGEGHRGTVGGWKHAGLPWVQG